VSATRDKVSNIAIRIEAVDADLSPPNPADVVAALTALLDPDDLAVQTGQHNFTNLAVGGRSVRVTLRWEAGGVTFEDLEYAVHQADVGHAQVRSVTTKSSWDVTLAAAYPGIVRRTVTLSPNSGAAGSAKSDYDRLLAVPKEALATAIASCLSSEAELRERVARTFPTADQIELVGLLGRRPRTTLLVGDPGTGKTTAVLGACAIAAEGLGRSVVVLQLDHALRGMGIQAQAATLLAEFFAAFRSAVQASGASAMLFLDEAEVVAGARSRAGEDSGAMENVALVDSLIVGVDDLAASGLSVALVLVTNTPERIDPAVARRSRILEFRRPSAAIAAQFAGQILERIGLPSAGIVGQLSSVWEKWAIAPTFSDVERELTTCLEQALLVGGWRDEMTLSRLAQLTPSGSASTAIAVRTGA
jgi:hypothetical protein